jgi:hypothetical protein
MDFRLIVSGVTTSLQEALDKGDTPKSVICNRQLPQEKKKKKMLAKIIGLLAKILMG